MICRRGDVYLVGAGPGDPDLLTIKGLRLLCEADVIIHDRLIGRELLDHCRQDALLIDVGKYPDHHRVSQEEINQLLIHHANQGCQVVRLKGGDPFVFGRGMEELQSCRAADIPCHVVPGISSSIAGPAAAGVPITTRGIARSFAVITGQTDPNLPEQKLEFEAWSRIDTLVFMMGRKNLKHLMSGLVAAGRADNTPVTCVERATMPNQRVVTGTLATIFDIVTTHGMSSPMVTIVGDVAALVDPDQLVSRIVREQTMKSPRLARNLTATIG